MVRQCLALRLVERRGSTALDASFWPFARFEARDLLILSVTRGLLQRSEKVAPHRMIRAISQAVRGCVKLPVMPRAVGCVRVTRSMRSRHVRQNITSVAMPVVRTAAAVPIAPIAATVASVPIAPIAATVADGPVTAATTVPTAPATVATAPATVATAPATVADGPVTAIAALSRSRNRSNRARDTHAEDPHRCVPFNVPHAFISCGNDSAFALSGWSTYKRFNGSMEVSCFFGLAGSMPPWGTEPAAGNHHVRQCLRLAQLDRYRSILGDVPLETIAKAVGLSAISLSNSSRSRPTTKPPATISTDVRSRAEGFG